MFIKYKMQRNKNKSWVEKYRPKKINSILEQNEIIMSLKDCLLNNHSLPHCLFYGPPGTGKTTTALALCIQLFGNKFFKERVLELNASDERGIKIVRGKIKTFAKKRITEIKDGDKYIPDYKIIILDEADAMTDESQFALRRIIEEYSKSTRFILICNYVAKINKAIISRCAIYRFKPLKVESVKLILKKIAKKENIAVTNKSINRILSFCEGDLRKAINTLQRLDFINNKKDKETILNEISISLSDENFNNLIELFKNNSNFSIIKKNVESFFKLGYGGNLLLHELGKKILISNKLSDLHKTLLFLKLSNLDCLLNNGSDEKLIIINFLTYFSLVLNKY